MRSVRLALVVASDATALLVLPGSAAQFVARVGRPRAWLLEVGVDRALVVAAGAAVWLAAAWLALGLLAAGAARLPGTAGRLGTAVGRCVLPRAVLGLVAGTTGLGLLLAPVAAGADPAPTPTVSAPAWPTTAPTAAPTPTPTVPAPAWPTAAPATTHTAVPTPAPTSVDHSAAPPEGGGPQSGSRPTGPARSQPSTAPPIQESGGPVRVHAGDSLWLLAGRRLGPDASDAEIAATWPRWYAANRAVIGADPALLQPGQVLRAPAPTREEIR